MSLDVVLIMDKHLRKCLNSNSLVDIDFLIFTNIDFI